MYADCVFGSEFENKNNKIKPVKNFNWVDNRPPAACIYLTIVSIISNILTAAKTNINLFTRRDKGKVSDLVETKQLLDSLKVIFTCTID